MTKKTKDFLTNKQKLLETFLDSAKKINEIVPTVQEAKDQVDLSIRTIKSAPRSIADSFNKPSIRSVIEADYLIWQFNRMINTPRVEIRNFEAETAGSIR